MNITLHLPTAAITVAIGSLALFGMSASAPQAPPSDRDIQAIVDVSKPSVDDRVWIYATSNQTIDFTVPTGKSLVISGVNGSGNFAILSIDAGPNQAIYYPQYQSSSVFDAIALNEGQVLTVLPSAGNKSLFGYLVDA